jgi:hypothetical protein
MGALSEPAAASEFQALWRLLTDARTLRISYGPGEPMTFPVAGAAELLGDPFAPSSSRSDPEWQARQATWSQSEHGSGAACREPVDAGWFEAPVCRNCGTAARHALLRPCGQKAAKRFVGRDIASESWDRLRFFELKSLQDARAAATRPARWPATTCSDAAPPTCIR